MADDSLVIADLIEVLGQQGGVQSTLPSLQNAAGVGATFQVLAPASNSGSALGYSMSYDLGAPQPTTDIVQSLLLDGERPFGYRASNRTIKLPLIIKAPDQITMTAAREILMQLIDQQTWTLMWTPASTGLSLVFDCFRASPTVITYGFLQNRRPYAVISLEFQALPYGRNDPNGLVQVPFISPLTNGVAAPPAAVVLDNFSSVAGTGWSRSTTKFVAGPGSAHYTPGPWPQLAASYSKGSLSVNITGLTTLSVWLGQSYDTTHFGPWPAMASNVTLTWTLTDNLTNKLSFHKTYNKCPWSNDRNSPIWTRITAAIPQNSATFNYTNVTAYSVRIQNWTSGGVPFLARIQPWMDAITANPPSLAQPASQRGTTYTVMGITGTARTPVSCQFQLPQSGTMSTELQGTGLWWPPTGVTNVKAECIGAGGAGGSRTTVGLGGGGGGGEYAAEATTGLTVSPGTPVPYSCGTSGAPGATAQVVTFVTPGTGNWVCPTGVTTIKAECWGGGAGGAPGGGGGGGGSYAAEASLAVTAGKTYQFIVGSGGSGGGTPGAGNNTVTARNGGWSKFIGDSVTVTGFGGLSGLSGGTTGGAGGVVSGNTTHFAGGAGGTAPSYGGGGGGGSGGTASAGNTGSAGSGNTGGAGGTAVTNGAAGGAGANNPGWPGAGVVPGGGGGGGFSASYNGGGGNGASGKVQVTYTVNAGAPTAGGSTTFGSALSSGTVVTAHGGSSVAVNTATGGAGGTGSANTTHFNGGAGFTATSGGGGGGGSGGSASAGTTATSATGAPAVAGGGKGANGGVTGTNDFGDAASLPGGGGGGACETSTSQLGGLGGAGSVVLTWTPPLAQWETLIAHRPSQNAPLSLNPCVPINNTADAPSSIQYSVPSLISGTNAQFNGTYSVVLINYAWDNPTASRQVSVTVTQYEYGGGTPGNAQSLSYPVTATRTITPSTDIVNGICMMGELTLPIKDIDPSNTSAYFTVSITDTNIVDQFLDVLFLDTQGQTVIINLNNNLYTNFFIDEPTSDRDLGRVMGSDLDRSQAISVLDSAICSGGPFYVQPGDNAFLVYSPSGAPSLGMSMLPRWFTDRLV